MKNTIIELTDSGNALSFTDYRFSTIVPFPAQVQDCNQALQYLYDHAAQFGLYQNRIALMGFSARDT